MKKNGSRMRILSVYDLSARESLEALRHMRRYNLHIAEKKPLDEVEIEGDEVLRRVYELVGGRTSYLSRVARASDMVGEFAADAFKLNKQTRPSAWCRWRRGGCSPSTHQTLQFQLGRDKLTLSGSGSSQRWMTMSCERNKDAHAIQSRRVLSGVRHTRQSRTAREFSLTAQGRTKVKRHDRNAVC